MPETLQGEFIPFPQQIILGETDRRSFVSFTKLNREMFILFKLTFQSGVIHWTALLSYVVC